MQKQQQYKKWYGTTQILLGVLFLFYGCVIYLLFRSKTLYIYRWCLSLGISDYIDYCRYLVKDYPISDFIRFCLPDGLYCAAYILFIDAIWRNDNKYIKYSLLSFVPIITISSEVLQYFNAVPGTFDIVDLICYMIPPLCLFL